MRLARLDGGRRGELPLGVDPVDDRRRPTGIPVFDTLGRRRDEAGTFAGAGDGDPGVPLADLDIVLGVGVAASQAGVVGGGVTDRVMVVPFFGDLPWQSAQVEFAFFAHLHKLANTLLSKQPLNLTIDSQEAILATHAGANNNFGSHGGEHPLRGNHHPVATHAIGETIAICQPRT